MISDENDLLTCITKAISGSYVGSELSMVVDLQNKIEHP